MTVLLSGGCQNELSFPPAVPAQGSLHDPNGDCYPIVVSGIYKQDTALNTTNFVDINLSVTAPGTYNIISDNVNGYSFQGSGTIASAGVNTIRLAGSGQPVAEGTDTFHISFGGAICEVTVQVISNTTTPAVFTLGSSGATCTGAVLAGTYASGGTVTSANTATLNITVTSGGPYDITTPTVNGVYFSGSGVLSASATSVVLTAHGVSGASTTDVVSDYSVSAGGSACTFSVTYVGVPAGPASFTFDCATMDPVITSPNTLRIGIPLDPAVDIVTVTVNVITAGSYSITSVTSQGGPDGIDFNTSGVFATTGNQVITLRGQGTPTRAGIVFYNVSSPQATNPTPCSTGAYYDFLLCTIGSSFNTNFTFLSQAINDNASVAGYDLVRMKGFTSETSNESLELIIGLPTGGSFDNTSSIDDVYTVNDAPAKYVKAIYSDGNTPQVVYSAETNGTTQTNPFTITITFCTGGRIEGNFSGVVKDNNGAGPGTKAISGTFGLVR